MAGWVHRLRETRQFFFRHDGFRAAPRTANIVAIHPDSGFAGLAK